MSRGWKIFLIIAGVLLLAAIVLANLFGKRKGGTEVFVEKIVRKDLEAVVRESGKVRARTSVPLSANTIGQVKDVCAREGDQVKAGQLVIEIDPAPFETAIAQAEASVRDGEKQLEIAGSQLDRAKKRLTREVELGTASTQEKKDELQTDIDVAARQVEEAELHVTSSKATLEQAKHELTKVRITSPIDGVVLRTNVEKGQNTVMGAMNSAGTELMTIADLSVLQVELEVGEASIMEVKAAQEARVEIDALPNRKLKGKVTEVGTSPIQATNGQERGVCFKVVVTLDETVEGVRPGFSASAEIVTATRKNAVCVPIRALVARDLPIDENEKPLPDPPGPSSAKKKTFEGVVRIHDDKGRFQAVKVGICGKEDFEVLEGLSEGDEVVTGPHKSLRDLKDDERVQRRAE